MAGGRWEMARTELRCVRSRVVATAIAFLAVALLALVGGEPAFEHADRARFQLNGPATLSAALERARPGQTVVSGHEQDGRMLRPGVISVVLDEDPRQSYLVVGFDMNAQRQIVLDSLWRHPGITVLTTVVAGLVASVLVGRVAASGGLGLDVGTRCTVLEDRQIELSAREFAMARAFLESPGQVLTREHLLNKVWGYDVDGSSTMVDVYGRCLRSNLGTERIVTVRGAGHRLAEL